MIRPTMTTIAPTNTVTPQRMLLKAMREVYDEQAGDEAKKQSLLPVVKDWLAEQHEQLNAQFAQLGRPRQYMIQHAAIYDMLLSSLFGLITLGSTPKVALAAVGGYGRKEMFPYSDLDVLFIYDHVDEAAAKRIVNFILYILWDVGARVGQSMRTVEECVMMAKQDHTICTNLLDLRYVAGRRRIYNSLHDQFRHAISGREITGFVEDKLQEREDRHQRFGDSRYVLEPNVKDGKGALRDIHTIWWLARYLYPIRRMRDLVRMGLLSEQEYNAFNQARQFLWMVRISLHMIAGRAEERLTFDQQQALAEKMGYQSANANRAIERFMRRYFVSVRIVGNMTRVICAILEEEKLHLPRRTRTLHSSWQFGDFELRNQRLMASDERIFSKKPIAMIEVFHIAQKHELDIHPRTYQQIARNLKQVDLKLQNDEAANALFMEILLGPRCENILRRMSDAGVLGRFIPDFGRIIGQTQFNMYHAYTVDEHTLVALGILQNIENGHVYDELPLATDIIKRIKMRRVLYLATFCHDIAKGRHADHSELGEIVATRLARRFGFSPDEVATTAWLVRYHLLLSNTAFKRDVNDPKTIQDFVAMVRTHEQLKLLLVLTATDIRAVAPGVWNAWKGALMRDLYYRAEQAMGAGKIEIKERDAGQLAAAMQPMLAGWDEAAISDYVMQCPPNMLAHFDREHHVTIAQMRRQVLAHETPIKINTRHTPEHDISEIIICTEDQNGLFSKIAGCFSLSGANIISAKIFTTNDGVAVDVFQVQNQNAQAFDQPDKLAKLASYLERALTDTLDFKAAFAERKMSLSLARRGVPIPGQVFVDNDASDLYSVIEVSGMDRPGFLHAVTSEISALKLSIANAHITTYGLQVADVFYVKNAFGLKITNEANLRSICKRLQDCVNEVPEKKKAKR